MQALEGPQENVHQIFNSTKKDPRNTGIVALLEKDITVREFSHWTMGFKNLNTVSAATLPGFVDIFNSKLDTEIVCVNKSATVKILMFFAKKL